MLRIMVPKVLDLPNFPKPLQSLYQSSFYQLNYVELFSSTCGVEAHDQLNLTTEMVDTVEKETQDQSHSKLCYWYHAGQSYQVHLMLS